MDNAIGKIPGKIANAWVIAERTDAEALFGYRNGFITISFQKNEKTDKETIYQAALKALNKHFKINQDDQGK